MNVTYTLKIAIIMAPEMLAGLGDVCRRGGCDVSVTSLALDVEEAPRESDVRFCAVVSK